ncbi:antitoxin [Pseudokineococcus lusitanus]|uniref:Antitoxin protein of toxin-antitoxin system n=1 Tax=Pseudokineococcus lusitanus TaxID=763993 RepID=A0A3N1GAQ1_9ACTN|nr:antitoxin [Pseudokineococcus lusitanus]ROP27315.1 antitoxin protein of toxin-antitoxin system [Pseudokineococcus lusitanus]
MALNIGRLVGQARRFASQNPDKVTSGLDRLGDVVDRRTGGKHASQIAKAKDAASKALGGSTGRRPEDGTDGPVGRRPHR